MLSLKGFTFIELLIVMAIIGAIATIFVTSFPAAQKRSRNLKRGNDLSQYELGLKNYAVRHGGLYPSRTTSVEAADELCTSLGLTNCPDDVRCSTGFCANSYRYWTVDGTGGGAANSRNYILWAQYEDIATAGTRYWVICSNGASGEMASAPTSASCPL
jgi:prepilin-type N-terminal cleavage/methylation domain-containing protein